MLFVEKYCPTTITEILGNEEVIKILSSMDDDFPHLLLTGPPGTGKTTASHIIKKDFDTLELNASDERGIDTIRSLLKNFCLKNSERKLVILDECDHLTTPAQQALRRLMETTDTKFILICNQISQIIEPIQSRCAVLKFEKIPSAIFINRLKEICEIEKISMTESGFEALINICHGDFRACLNCLQGVSAVKKTIDDEFLYKVNGTPNYKILENIFENIKAKNLEKALEIFNTLWILRFESTDLLDGFFKIGKSMDNYEVLKIIGKYQLRLNDGVNSRVQFYAMFCEISKLF